MSAAVAATPARGAKTAALAALLARLAPDEVPAATAFLSGRHGWSPSILVVHRRGVVRCVGTAWIRPSFIETSIDEGRRHRWRPRLGLNALRSAFELRGDFFHRGGDGRRRRRIERPSTRKTTGLPAMGDIRRCLSALVDPPVLGEMFEHRFSDDLNGHALGNLVIAVLGERAGSGCHDELGRLLACSRTGAARETQKPRHAGGRDRRRHRRHGQGGRSNSRPGSSGSASSLSDPKADVDAVAAIDRRRSNRDRPRIAED